MLKSPTSGSSTSLGALQQNISEIIQLLESNNINVIEETSNLVRDSLSSTNEPWLLNGLIDYYIHSKNVLVRRLLTGIRQSQHKNLLMKIDEYLQKPATRYSSLNLFGHIVRKDPAWIHHTVQSRAFSTIIKCLQLENDVLILTLALYVVSTLFPKVPTKIGPTLNQFFSIFVRLIEWKYLKAIGNKLNMANFNLALFTFFLCLYGMYPCSFIKYLQQYYCKSQSPSETKPASLSSGSSTETALTMSEKRKIFDKCVVPMLKQVRVHPNLILYSQGIEVHNEKWRKMESHDILAEISQLQIDLNESLFQDGSKSNQSVTIKIPKIEASDCELSSILNDVNDSELSMCPDVGLDSCTIWSPSMELGLSTPPPSRSMTPTHGQSNDSNDPKPKIESDVASNSKSRPTVLSIPPIGKSLSDSTPSTPTQNVMPFEFEKIEEQNTACDASTYFSTQDKKSDANFDNSDAQTRASSELKFSTQLVVSHACGEDAFVDITCNSTQNTCTATMTVKGDNCITEFSPALQPSAESQASSISSRNDSSQDSLFIEAERPSVREILQHPDTRSTLTLSPDELLQREIQFCVENEGKSDWLSGLFPLSEKESRAARNTILQLQCALLYEQHCRKQHSTRARRLMRKIYESSALEEKNKALLQTISQKDNEIKHLHSVIKLRKSEFRSHESELQRSLDLADKKISELSDQLKNVTSENQKLRDEKEKDMADLNREKAVARNAKSDMFKYKLQLETEMKNRETVCDLNEQIVHLQREMIIVEELRRKMETIERNSNDFKTTEVAKYKMLIDAFERESSQLENDLREKSVQYDFMKAKSSEMEKRVEKKNRLLEEQKKYLENVKSLARGQIQAMEAKYQAQKNVTMHIELQMLEQYSKLTALEGHQSSNDHITSSSSKPIQPHSLGLQSRYGHLMEACPELSPPVKSSLMTEIPVATSELEASTGTVGPNH